MNSESTEPGIEQQAAPPLGVPRWLGADGQPLASFDLGDLPGAYKLVFCFQHNCPGCHSSGFPTLARLVQALPNSPAVSFCAVQTVFEEFEHNTWEHLQADRERYALPIPFGHDEGQGREGAGSVLMQRYRSGGTPWFILIDPNDTVVFNHFSLDAERAIEFFQRVQAQLADRPPEPADPHVLTWRGVMQRVRQGNLPPPARVERSEAEWRAMLSAEAFRVTRQAGTERAHSSDMCSLFEPGRYACVCCGTELFDASTKFESHSGWPSFTQAVAPDVVAYHGDASHGMVRVETTCAVCDAHLGHVFPDGPAPSGLRFCINAAALSKLPSA